MTHVKDAANIATLPAPRTVTDATLLDLALDVFADAGYDGASVRDICRRLDVSHNLVHERFGSKDQLWRAAIDHGFRELAHTLAEAAQAVSADPLVRLRSVLIAYVEAIAAKPALIRIIQHEAGHPGERLEHVFTQYLQPAHAVADAALRLLEMQGRARRIPAATLHFLVGHGAGGLASLPELAGRFTERDPDPVSQAREAVDIILRGIITGPIAPDTATA